MTGAPTALSTAGLATGVAAPGGGPPAVAGCGYGAVEAWAPLADPVNVAFLAGASSGASPSSRSSRCPSRPARR